jgi:hypothetical protein
MLYLSAGLAGATAYKLAFLTGAPHLGNGCDVAGIRT